MNASEIYEPLYRHFMNYDYKLCNSYIYNWECDFFGISKSGYQLEVEVKVSRSDFFRDFEKEKHRLFNDFVSKKTHHIYRTGRYYWDKDNVICNVRIPKVEFDFDGHQYGGSHRTKYNWRMVKVGDRWLYVVNDYGRAHISYEFKEIRAECTSIKIKPLTEILCPHSFYYACPENLIKIEELPKYAGLIFVSEGGRITVVKKAPYLHKNKSDLTSVLLQKFYNLWTFNTTLQTKMELFTQPQPLNP